MSVSLPSVLDAWRAVATGRCFDGELSLAGFSRLKGSLTDTEGECRFRLEFGRDALGLAYVDVGVQARLPLQCQRSLERYLHRVVIQQRLGLIADSAQEAALPPEMEPLWLGEGGEVRPAELIEDELILALPVVPIDPEADVLPFSDEPDPALPGEEKPNPFAALAALKDQLK